MASDSLSRTREPSARRPRSARTRPLVVLLLTAAAVPVLPRAARAQASPQARVDRIFAAYDHPSSPGCAVGVVEGGRLAYAHGYGSANLDYGVPLSDSSVFYMASVSKQFTAAAVAIAAKQGKLSLSDDVRKWLPELPDYGKTITIDNLIHHTSGIRDYLTLMPLAGLRYEDVLTDEALLGLIARQKELNFEPGSEYLYSNSGYVLLSMIVKRATGKSLREFAEENIFRPLGMTHTHFHDEPLHPIRNRAVGYDRSGDAFEIDYYTNFDKVGDGGLYTSIADLYRWEQAFYDDALGIRQQELRRGVLTNGDTIAYAFGLTVGQWRRLPTVEHGGAFMGYRTEILRFPQQRLSVLTLCNLAQTNPSELSRRVAEVYLGDRLKPEAAVAKAAPAKPPETEVALTPAELAAYAGSYASDELQATYQLRIEGDTLRLQRRIGEPIALRATARDAFAVAGRGLGGVGLTFQRDASGAVTGFTIQAGRVRNIRFERR